MTTTAAATFRYKIRGRARALGIVSIIVTTRGPDRPTLHVRTRVLITYWRAPRIITRRYGTTQPVADGDDDDVDDGAAVTAE